MSGGGSWLAAYLLLPLAGAPLLAHPNFRDVPLAARAMLAGAAAAVVLSYVMTAEALLGVAWQWPVLLPLSAALAAVCRTFLRAERQSLGLERRSRSAFDTAASLLA